MLNARRWLLVVADDEPEWSSHEAEPQGGQSSSARLLAAQLFGLLEEAHQQQHQKEKGESDDSGFHCRILGMREALQAFAEENGAPGEILFGDEVSGSRSSHIAGKGQPQPPAPESLEVVVLCEPSLGSGDADALAWPRQVPQRSSALCQRVLSLVQALLGRPRRNQQRASAGHSNPASKVDWEGEPPGAPTIYGSSVNSRAAEGEHAVAANAAASSPRLWLITRGVVTLDEEHPRKDEAVAESTGLSGLVQAPLWGLGR